MPSTFPTRSYCISLLLLPRQQRSRFPCLECTHSYEREGDGGPLVNYLASPSLSVLLSTEARGATSQDVVGVKWGAYDRFPPLSLPSSVTLLPRDPSPVGIWSCLQVLGLLCWSFRGACAQKPHLSSRCSAPITRLTPLPPLPTSLGQPGLDQTPLHLPFYPQGARSVGLYLCTEGWLVSMVLVWCNSDGERLCWASTGKGGRHCPAHEIMLRTPESVNLEASSFLSAESPKFLQAVP